VRDGEGRGEEAMTRHDRLTLAAYTLAVLALGFAWGWVLR
jgi:hypothetical protein